MATPLLMNLPLEIRHRIFSFVATRDTHQMQLLRKWFEKQEVKQLTAQQAVANANELAEKDDDGDGNDDDDDSEEETEDDGDEAEEADEEDSDDDEAQPSPPAPAIQASPKWRHIPNFLRITRCPPSVELLLTSKQLNAEVTDWFYDVAVVLIRATGSFAHTAFFEEAFTQISQAEFSPMQNIRKVLVIFPWDTAWLRAHTANHVEAIFPALLRQRSACILDILTRAPRLKQVTIHWHDSAQDEESGSLMQDVLAGFHNLPVTMNIQEHYILASSKPPSKSIAGITRMEFQGILDKGLDRLC